MLVTKPQAAIFSTRTEVRRVFEGSSYNGAPDQVTSTTSNVRTAWNDTRTTYDSPSWRKRISEGENATGFLAGSRRWIEQQDGYAYRKIVTLPSSPTQRYSTHTTMRGSLATATLPTILGLADTRANNQALQRFYSNARAAQTTLQGLVVAGELGQTLRGINHASNGIYRGLWNYVNSLRKGTVLRNLRLLSQQGKLKAIRERYLEFVFGIKPLLADIDDAARLLGTDQSLLREWKAISGYGEDETEAFQSLITGGFCWQYQLWTENRVQIRYMGAVQRRADVAGTIELNSSGFDSSNWLPALWELIPYSFVADYFFNIQHILSAWSFHKASIRWAAKTVRHTRVNETRSNQQTVFSSGDSIYDYQPGYSAYVVTDVTREALDTGNIGVPTLMITIPGLSMKWLNLAALFGAARSTQKLIR